MMEKLTKLSIALGFGLLLASFVNIYVPFGLLAVGAWVFAYIYDDDFRRKFL